MTTWIQSHNRRRLVHLHAEKFSTPNAATCGFQPCSEDEQAHARQEIDDAIEREAAQAPPPLDTTNRFQIGLLSDSRIKVLRLLPSSLTVDDALNLAAYLVALADPDAGKENSRFSNLLKAIREGK